MNSGESHTARSTHDDEVTDKSADAARGCGRYADVHTIGDAAGPLQSQPKTVHAVLSLLADEPPTSWLADVVMHLQVESPKW